MPNPCTMGLVAPEDNELDYFITWSTGSNQYVPLPNILNGDCEFEVSMTVTSGLTWSEISTVIIQTDQPTFTAVPGAINSDSRVKSLATDGQIIMNTQSLTTRKDIAIQLTVSSKKNIHDNAYIRTNFVVVTSYCPSVFTSAVSGEYELTSYLRQSKTALITLDAQDTRACTRTKFQTTFNSAVIAENAILPDWFSFEVNEIDGSPSQGTLSAMWTEDYRAVGRHTVKAYEYNWDDNTSFFVQDIQVDILDPCVLSSIDVPDYTFEMIYKQDTNSVLVQWYPFKVTPEDDEHCPPKTLQFTASISPMVNNTAPTYSFVPGQESREIVVILPTMEETSEITFEVVEAVYAIDVMTETSQLKVQTTMTDSIEIEYVEVEVTEEVSIDSSTWDDDSNDDQEDEVTVRQPTIEEELEITTFEDFDDDNLDELLGLGTKTADETADEAVDETADESIRSDTEESLVEFEDFEDDFLSEPETTVVDGIAIEEGAEVTIFNVREPKTACKIVGSETVCENVCKSGNGRTTCQDFCEVIGGEEVCEDIEVINEAVDMDECEEVDDISTCDGQWIDLCDMGTKIVCEGREDSPCVVDNNGQVVCETVVIPKCTQIDGEEVCDYITECEEIDGETVCEFFAPGTQDFLDFGDLEDDFEEDEPEVVPTLENWEKPQPEPFDQVIIVVDGRVTYVPPQPVRIEQSEIGDSGDLKMKFKSPVLVPPFFKGKGTAEATERRLQDEDVSENETNSNGGVEIDSENDTNSDDEAENDSQSEISSDDEVESDRSDVSRALEEILEFKIQSQFFDPDSDELSIDTLELIKFTPTEFEIQLSFKNTAYVSQSLTEPDIVEVRIKRGDLFVDAVTFEVLDPDFVMFVRLPPQVSPEAAEGLNFLNEVVGQAMRSFSILLVGGNLIMGYGLIYVWNLVNFSQLFVIVNQWKINITPEAKIVLDQLRMLAFFDFIETAWFMEWIQDLVRFDAIFEQEDENLEATESDQTKQPETEFKRLGSANVIENMGIMLFFAFVILVVCLCLLVVAIVVSFEQFSTQSKDIYMKLHYKVYWNTFIRYAFQSTLKMQVAAVASIAVSLSTITTISWNMPLSMIITVSAALALLVVYNLIPFVFGCILKRNKKQLDQGVCKDKYGEMYETLSVKYMKRPPTILWNITRKKSNNSLPNWDTLFYPIAFLLRRTVFVMITFLLFSYPGIQINALIYSSLLYVIFITHYPEFSPRTILWAELANEAILLLVCYHMILLSNLVWDPIARSVVGFSLIACIFGLLAGNTFFIVRLNLRKYSEKKKYGYFKAKHDKVMQERQVALDVLACADIFNETLDADKDTQEMMTNKTVLKYEKRLVRIAAVKAASEIMELKAKTADEKEEKRRLKHLRLNKWEHNQIKFAYPGRKKQLIKRLETLQQIEDEENQQMSVHRNQEQAVVLSEGSVRSIPTELKDKAANLRQGPSIQSMRKQEVLQNVSEHESQDEQDESAWKENQAKKQLEKLHGSIESIQVLENDADQTKGQSAQDWFESPPYAQQTEKKKSKSKNKSKRQSKNTIYEGGSEETPTMAETKPKQVSFNIDQLHAESLQRMNTLSQITGDAQRGLRNFKTKTENIAPSLRKGFRKKQITKEQRLKAIEFVKAVTVMKKANSDTIRNKEFFSEYELKVTEELYMEAQKTRPGFCPKRHPLKMVFDRYEVKDYDDDARCDKCHALIDLNHLYMVGFLHCKKCEYDVCAKCAKGNVKIHRNELIDIEESVEEGDEENLAVAKEEINQPQFISYVGQRTNGYSSENKPATRAQVMQFNHVKKFLSSNVPDIPDPALKSKKSPMMQKLEKAALRKAMETKAPESLEPKSEGLSDKTQIQGYPWAQLKFTLPVQPKELDSFFQLITSGDKFIKGLNFSEKQTLSALYSAQWAQGNMDALKHTNVPNQEII